MSLVLEKMANFKSNSVESLVVETQGVLVSGRSIFKTRVGWLSEVSEQFE